MKDINNLTPSEELELQMHNTTTEVVNLISMISKLPVDQKTHILDMFNRVEQGEAKDEV